MRYVTANNPASRNHTFAYSINDWLLLVTLFYYAVQMERQHTSIVLLIFVETKPL